MADTPRASYTTEDGLERIFATTVLDAPLFERLERWRRSIPSGAPGSLAGSRPISRSEALRLLLDQHLPQLPAPDAIHDA